MPCYEKLLAIGLMCRQSRIKGWGARGNFRWRAPMT